MSLEKDLEKGYEELAKSNLNDPEFFGNYRKVLKEEIKNYRYLLNVALAQMNSAAEWINEDADPGMAAHMLQKTRKEILDQLPENHDK